MNPDINLRLGPLKKALAEVVLPALPESERLARDQAMLVIGHLDMIAKQWQYALRFEIASCDALCELARELVPLLGDAPLVHDVHKALDAIARVDKADYAAVQGASRALAELIDRAVSGDYHKTPLDPRVRDAVLTHAESQSRRERTWFAGNGLDPDPQPPIGTLFAGNAGST